jgi:hypothetical protein
MEFDGRFDSQVEALLAMEVVPRFYCCSTIFDCVLPLIGEVPSIETFI